MVEPQKPFACGIPDCGMTFTNEDHLHVHTKKHDMVLQLGMEQKAAFVADQTPTPTRFIRNCEEVGLFQDLQNVTVNPFDEGFKRAMETKHGILSLENVIAGSTSDDVLHTPQMVFPTADAGDATLYSATNNQRNITISRSSSDETGTIKEYETTTISKLTNEVTTVSRVVENKEISDKIGNTDNIAIVKNTENTINETILTNITVHNTEIRKEVENRGPVLVYSDSVTKDKTVLKKDVVSDNDKVLPPIMSQRSLDFVVDSLTSEMVATDTCVVKGKDDVEFFVCDKPPSGTTEGTNNKQPERQFMTILRNIAPKKPRIIPKPTRYVNTDKNVAKNIVAPKKLDNYEILITFPNGKQVKMKAVEEVSKPDPKKLLRRTIESKKPARKVQNKVQSKVIEVPKNRVVQISNGTLIPVKLINQAGKPISPNEINLPIAHVAETPKNNNKDVAVNDVQNKSPATKQLLTKPIVTKINPKVVTKILATKTYQNCSTKQRKIAAAPSNVKVNNEQATYTHTTINDKNMPLNSTNTSINATNVTSNIKTTVNASGLQQNLIKSSLCVTNIQPNTITMASTVNNLNAVNSLNKIPIMTVQNLNQLQVKFIPFTIQTPDTELNALKVSQPFHLEDKHDTVEAEKEKPVENSGAVDNLMYNVTQKEIYDRINESVNEESASGGNADQDYDKGLTHDEVNANGEVRKRRKSDLESRCAASRRYRERLKTDMWRKTQENRQLREANKKLIAEKAVLKLLITEHMRRCPHADDLRISQEKLQTMNLS